MANCEIPTKKVLTVSDIFSPDKINRYSSYVNTLIGDVFRKYISDTNYTISDLSNPVIANQVYSRVNHLLKALVYAHITDFAEVDADTDLPRGFRTIDDALSPEIVEDLKKIVRNFEEFKKFHINNSSVFSIDKKAFSEEISDNEDQDETSDIGEDVDDEHRYHTTNEEGSDKMQKYDKASNEEDSYYGLTKEVKAVFSLLGKENYNPETNRYEIAKDANGLPLSAISNSVYTLLISKINDVKDEEILKQKLKDDSLRRLVPEINQINTILKLDNIAAATEQQKQLWVDFQIAFSKPAINIETILNKNLSTEPTGAYYIKVNDIKGNIEKIKQSWIYNFDLRKVRPELLPLLKVDATKKVYYAKESVLPFPEDIDQALRFLETLGIKISTDNIVEDDVDYTHKQIISNAQKVHGTVVQLVTIGATEQVPKYITNPLREISQGDRYRKIYSQSTAINQLVAIESKYSTLIPSMVSKNAIGELQYLINDESNISLAMHYLKNAKTLKELFNSPPFTNLKYNTLYPNSTILNFLFDKNGNRKENNYLTLTLQSGSKTKDNKNIISRKFTSKKKLINDFNSMLTFGKTDVMRLETSHSFYSVGMKSKATLEFSKDPDRHYFEPYLFEKDFLTNNLVSDQFLKYLNSEIQRINNYAETIKKEPYLSKYPLDQFNIFDKLSTELQSELKATTGIDKAHPLYSKFITEMEGVFQQELQKFEQTLKEDNIKDKDLFGQQLLEKYPNVVEDEIEKYERDSKAMLKKAFLVNSLVQNIEFGILFSGDALFYTDMHKRLKAFSSTGVYPNMSPTANTIVADSNYAKNYSYKSLFEQNGVVFKEKKVNHIYTQVLKDKLLTEYLGNPLSKPGKVTDGQGWGNPDFLHELSIRQGWRNEYTETVFKRESLIMKRDILEMPLSEAEKDLLTNLEDKIFANPELYTVTVLKAGFSGPMLNTNVDARIYDKFSVAPLFPSFAKNQPRLRKILVDMVQGQYDYVKYDSGSKVFKKPPIDVEKLNTATPNVVSKALFKLQIATNNKAKETTTIPTQLLKLIFANQFDNGVAKNAEINELYNNYIATLNDIQVEQVTQLLDTLGIETNSVGIKKINYQKLSEKLIEEATKRGMNDNVIYALQYNINTGYFNIHPEIVILTELEKLISSIADKTLRRFKVNGGDFVLITNGESSKLRYYTTDKENGTKTTKAETRITLTKEFSRLLNKPHPKDGEKIGTLDRLNALLKTEWAIQNEESLTVIYDRVPTQELNSMDVGIIVEFIDPIMGNVVQLPDEAVIKAGLDFDFDKEKTILPSFNNEGNLIKYENKSRKQIDEAIVLLKAERNKLYGNYNYQLRNLNKSFLEAANDEELQKVVENIYLQEDEIKNILTEIKSVVNLINDEREPEDYIGYTERKASTFINRIFNLNQDSLKPEMYALKNQLNDELLKRVVDLNKEYTDKLNLLLPIMSSDKYNDFIKQQKNAINLDGIQVFLENSKAIRELYSYKGNYFKNYSNQILNQYSEALLKPDRFDELTRPNQTIEIEKLAEDISKLTGSSSDLPKGGDVYTYLNNLNVFNTFFSAKNMLGPYAKINTVQQVLAYSGAKLNNFLNTGLNNKTKKYSRTTSIYHMLLTPQQIEEIEQNEKILIAKNTDVNGKNIQEGNSQSINATVDAANNPYFAKLLLNNQNIGIEILLTSIFKYPKELAVTFLNHAGLRSYYKNRENGKTKEEAKLDIIRRLGLKTIDNTIYTEVVPREQYASMLKDKSYTISTTKIADAKDENGKMVALREVTFTQDKQIPVRGKVPYSFDNIIRKIQEGNGFEIDQSVIIEVKGKNVELAQLFRKDPFIPLEGWQELAKPVNDVARAKNDEAVSAEKLTKLITSELKAFAFFFNMETVNFAFMDLSNYLSFDTKKVSGALDLEKRIKLRQKILNSEIISEPDLVILETNTPIAPFENTGLLKEMYKTFMPIISSSTDNLYNIIDKYNENYLTKTVKGTRALNSSIQSQFIYSIIYNFGEQAKNGFNLLTRINETDANGELTYMDIIQRLENFKNSKDYKMIAKKFPILDSFVANIHTRERSQYFPEIGSVMNIQFLKNPQMTPTEESDIIFQLRQLWQVPIYEKEEDAAKNAKIKKLITDLFDVALAQSGLSTSFISFREFIPIEYYKKDAEKALTTYNALPAIEKKMYTQTFANLFTYNNPTLFPSEKVWSEQQVGWVNIPNPNNSSQKIKFYDIQTKTGNKIKQEAFNQNIEVVERYSNADLKANPNKIYVFGDNLDRKGTGGQAQIRNNPNAFGIATKVHPTNKDNAFMSDNNLETNKKAIDEDIQKILDQNKPIILAKDGYGTGLAKLKEKAPQTYQYLKDQLLSKFGFNNDTGEISTPTKSSIVTEAPVVAAPISSEAVVKPVAKKELSQNLTDILNKTNLEENEWKIENINGVDTLVVLKFVPPKINKNSKKFYSAYGVPGMYVERYGKELIVPGFENIQVMIEQGTNEVFELTTGLSLPKSMLNGAKSAKNIIIELQRVFVERKIEEAIEKTTKLPQHLLSSQQEGNDEIPPCS